LHVDVEVVQPGKSEGQTERRLDHLERRLLLLANVLVDIDEQVVRGRNLVDPEGGGGTSPEVAGLGGDGGGDQIAILVVRGAGVGAVVQRQGDLLSTRRKAHGCSLGHGLPFRLV
jgi:hypothetical protein